jgi:hypothetical protein
MVAIASPSAATAAATLAASEFSTLFNFLLASSQKPVSLFLALISFSN